MGLEEYASKGYNKYTAKVSGMKSSYGAAASRASGNYAAAGFGPTRTGNYQKAISSYAQANYNPTSSWADKWRTKGD